MAEKKHQTLKIAFVLDGGLEKPDGVQQYILTLGEWFKAGGHQIKYIVAGKIVYGSEDAVSLSRNIKVSTNGNKVSIPLPASRKLLKYYISTEKFDVVHVQVPYSPLLGEQLIFLSHKTAAIIGTFHVVPINKLLNVGDWLLGLVSQLSVRRFDKMLSVSTAAQKIAKRDYHIDSEVLPNVVDYRTYSLAKPFSKYKDGKVTILFFGRLVARKGCMNLLLAINKLVKDGYESTFRVLICGTGPLENNLKQYVRENNLSDIVTFLGFITEEDKPRYYASADISVFPSLGGESFGIVLLEAMASGKSAVIGGNNIGYSTVLGSKPELLFDPVNTDVLALKLQKLIEDKTYRNEVMDWCMIESKQYDVKVVGERLLAIYKEILEKKTKTIDNLTYVQTSKNR